MTRGAVTEDLVRSLVTGSHAEGVTNLSVAAAAEHRGQILLIASEDVLCPSFELPVTAVLPGEHLLDALCRCLAFLGLAVADIGGYLGHQDTDEEDNYARVFYFAVTLTDPEAVCNTGRGGHAWVSLDDLDSVPSSAHLIELSSDDVT